MYRTRTTAAAQDPSHLPPLSAAGWFMACQARADQRPRNLPDPAMAPAHALRLAGLMAKVRTLVTRNRQVSTTLASAPRALPDRGSLTCASGPAHTA